MDRVLFRQGDVLLVRVDGELPPAAQPAPRDGRGRIVLALGEVTGHAHALLAPPDEAELYRVGARAEAVERYLHVRARAVALVHEEHATITVPAGLYRVVRQREYSPEAIRVVAD